MSPVLSTEISDLIIDLVYLSALHESERFQYYHRDLFASERQEGAPFYHQNLAYDSWKYDTTNLRACALVCKTWLARCRFHLFAKFIALNYAQFERRLAIFAKVSPNVRFVYLEGSDWDRWIIEALPRLAATFPCVTLLDLYKAHFEDLEDVAVADFLRPFSLLQCLFFSHCPFRSSSQFFCAMCACPNLCSLYCNSTWEHDNHPLVPPTMHKSFPRLISLSPSPNPTLLQWILAADTVPHVKTLRTGLMSEEELPILARTLAVLGSSLEELDLSGMDAGNLRDTTYFSLYSTHPPTGMFPGELNLSLNDHLRTIRFNVSLHLDWPGSNMEVVASRCSRILGQISSVHMEEVTIEIDTTTLDTLASIHLDEIDHALNRPNFRGLRMVRFGVSSDDVAAARGFLGQQMPGCESRGIIVVEA